MSRVLIVAEHLNGQLNAATARCVSCAAAPAVIQADTTAIRARTEIFRADMRARQ